MEGPTETVEQPTEKSNMEVPVTDPGEPIDMPDTSAEEQQAAQKYFDEQQRKERLCKEYLKDDRHDVCDCGALSNPHHGKSAAERLKISYDATFPETDFYDSELEEEQKDNTGLLYTPWRRIYYNPDNEYEVALRTYNLFTQPNQAIMIKSCYGGKESSVLMNYHQFTELYKLIYRVGYNHSVEKNTVIIEKLTGYKRLHVTMSETGLMLDDVYFSKELCTRLSQVGKSIEWHEVVQFFQKDIQTFPDFVPGFLF